jgi:hypothetical protein
MISSMSTNPGVGVYPVPVESSQLFPAPFNYEPYRALSGIHHWLILMTSWKLYRDWLLGSDVTLILPSTSHKLVALHAGESTDGERYSLFQVVACVGLCYVCLRVRLQCASWHHAPVSGRRVLCFILSGNESWTGNQKIWISGWSSFICYFIWQIQ